MYAAFIAFSVLALGCEYRFWESWKRSPGFTRGSLMLLGGWALAVCANLYTTYFAFFPLAGQGLHVLYKFWRRRSDRETKCTVAAVDLRAHPRRVGLPSLAADIVRIRGKGSRWVWSGSIAQVEDTPRRLRHLWPTILGWKRSSCSDGGRRGSSATPGFADWRYARPHPLQSTWPSSTHQTSLLCGI